MMRLRFRLLVCAVVVAASLVEAGVRVGHATVDAGGVLTFPETDHTLSGPFRRFWEGNGGLAVFGYPVAEPQTEQTSEGTYQVQYFERARFELHPEKAPPYDVLLGRLGDTRLRQDSRDWFAFPKGGPAGGCLFFAPTGHSVCDKAAGMHFRSYWEGHGLADRALSRFQRSLALFGMPLSEPTMETNAAGDTVLTQWFERARFEWHPDKPEPYTVLLGLLGDELRAAAPTLPTPTPISTPVTEAGYTALGDSFATGFRAQQGYVARYRDAIAADTGIAVNLDNLGQNGWTSGQLLDALKGDPRFRSSLAAARIVTWNIGSNDFEQARAAYQSGSCGGADNQDCFRSALATFKPNWDAIVAQITMLCPPGTAIIRALDIYNPFVGVDRAAHSWDGAAGPSDFDVYRLYLDAANDYILASSRDHQVPVADVYHTFNGVDGGDDPAGKGYLADDGLHPNDLGHTIIAGMLRNLGYAPLR